MCWPEGIFGCICLNTDVIVYFVGLQFAEHLTFPIFTLGFRRMLLKGHFLGKNQIMASSFLIFLKLNKIISGFICMLSLTFTEHSVVIKANTCSTLENREKYVIT
jgi:hypothetical protein